MRVLSQRDLSHAESAELLGAVEVAMLSLVGHGPDDVCARMATEHLATGGQRLRAMLALRAMSALGGDPARAVPWAAGCELLHNASLIHDDIQDEDVTRRGRPALWTQWGRAQAINAGDLLLILPTLAAGMVDTDDATRWHLAATVARHASETVRGQAYELDLRGDVHMDRDAYLRAATGKTAGLFGMPVEGSALLAGLAPERARALAAPFERLGLLYQLQDDVIDLYGDKGREARGADVREGKVSALVVAHALLHPADRLWLAGVLRTSREETTIEVVEEVMERFAAKGALRYVLDWIDEIGAEVAAPLRGEPALAGVALDVRERFMSKLRPIRAWLECGRRSA